MNETKKVKCSLSDEDVARVKSMGFLRDKTTADKFNARVITGNGKVTAEKMHAVAEASKLFGSGEVALTTRMSFEVQGISYKNIEPFISYLAEYGLEVGGTGPKVRPIVSCKGTTCRFGLIDTFGLSEEIHRRFYKGYHDVKLPHKFKIAVGGCPNNCVKPDINDLGIVGQKKPNVDILRCRGCKKCQVEAACPIKLARVENSKIVIDDTQCNHCGRCDGKCPFGAVGDYTCGYRIYLGGRWGKRVARGRYIDKLFESEKEVLDVVEKAILLFCENGEAGERFGDCIERIGFENACAQLVADDILKRKNKILGE